MKEQKQMQKSFIGIDVSKLTLDVCIINNEGFWEHQQFENNRKGFKTYQTI